MVEVGLEAATYVTNALKLNSLIFLFVNSVIEM